MYLFQIRLPPFILQQTLSFFHFQCRTSNKIKRVNSCGAIRQSLKHQGALSAYDQNQELYTWTRITFGLIFCTTLGFTRQCIEHLLCIQTYLLEIQNEIN